MREILQKKGLIVAALLLGALLAAAKLWYRPKVQAMDSWNVWLPFTFLAPIDPTAVGTVGDQVVVEHVLGFHQTSNIKKGFRPYYSFVSTDLDAKQMVLTPQFPMRRADGRPYSLQDYCNSVQVSFSGTRHGPVEPLQAKVVCTESTVEVDLAHMPAGLPFLFTWPDFSLFDATSRLIGAEKNLNTIGPYFVSKIESDHAQLERNPYFPQSLRANQTSTIHLRSYNLQEKGIGGFDSKLDPLVYLLGSSLTPQDMGELSKRGYQVELFPSEWFSFFMFNPAVDAPKREAFNRFLTEQKPLLKQFAPLGQDAYSIAPADRPFGLAQSKVEIDKEDTPSTKRGSRVRVGIYEGFLKEMPFMRYLKQQLEQHPEQFEVVVTDETDSAVKVFAENRADVIFRFLGISPDNPVGHLSYLLDAMPEIFDKVLSKEELGHAFTLGSKEFVPAVSALEQRLVDRGLVVPLLHFPGVVAHANWLERDESLAWNWGIQAWTYRVR